MNVPPAYAAYADAMIRAVDPRLTAEERQQAAEEASAVPEFVIGTLTGILMEYHGRAETMAALPSGTFADRLRRRAFGGRAPEDVIGYAINSARAGETVQFVHVDSPEDPASHTRARQAAIELAAMSADPFAPGGVTDEDVATERGWAQPTENHEPEKPRPIAEVAAEAETARRRRLAAEVTGVAQGRQYPGLEPGAEGLPYDGDPSASAAADLTGPAPQLPPEAQALLTSLRRQREQEAAVDVADPDDPRTMGNALRATQAVSGVAPTSTPAPDPAAATALQQGRSYPPPVRTPATPPAVCGHPTAGGPCALVAGHLQMPVPGTENGHLAVRR